MWNEWQNHGNSGKDTEMIDVLVKWQIYESFSKTVNYSGVEYLLFYTICESAELSQSTGLKLPKTSKNLRDASYLKIVFFLTTLVYTDTSDYADRWKQMND